METKYYESIYTVRVISDRHPGEMSGTNDLSAVLQECYDGDFVGEMVADTTREVTPEHAAALLIAAGSEPGFFGLDEEDDETTIPPPSYWRNQTLPSHDEILCFEVPGDFDMNDYNKNYDDVAVVMIRKSGERKPWPIQHGALGRFMGRNSDGAWWIPFDLEAYKSTR